MHFFQCKGRRGGVSLAGRGVMEGRGPQGEELGLNRQPSSRVRCVACNSPIISLRAGGPAQRADPSPQVLQRVSRQDVGSHARMLRLREEKAGGPDARVLQKRRMASILAKIFDLQ